MSSETFDKLLSRLDSEDRELICEMAEVQHTARERS